MALREAEIEPRLRIAALLYDQSEQLFFSLLVLLSLEQVFCVFEILRGAFFRCRRMRAGSRAGLRIRRDGYPCKQQSRNNLTYGHWIQSSRSLRCAPATFRYVILRILPQFLGDRPLQ